MCQAGDQFDCGGKCRDRDTHVYCGGKCWDLPSLQWEFSNPYMKKLEDFTRTCDGD